MRQKKISWAILMICLVGMLGVTSAASASTGSVVWIGSGQNNGWGGFMQRIMQTDYRLQMSNGTPYWNTLMLPVDASAASSGMTSYMGMPAFGFCPVPGQCYMVLVQNPVNSSASAANCPPVVMPVQPAPAQQGKPSSLW